MINLEADKLQDAKKKSSKTNKVMGNRKFKKGRKKKQKKIKKEKKDINF